MGGEQEKVARTRRSLPDASYCSWTEVGPTIRKAVANPPPEPLVPASRLAGYSGTPLPKKLGIKEGNTVALMGADRTFPSTLGSLPAWVTLHANARGKRDLTIWFVRSVGALRGAIPRMVRAAREGGVWIAWPKKRSGIESDVSEREVRALGLAAGLVDHKICAIDATWSGLRFALRKGLTPTRSSLAASS